MMIFAFGKASRQCTIFIQGGWKMMMPSPITLSRFVFLAFVASHGCVFGYDEVGDNHRVVHGSIRGTNAAMVKPDGSDRGDGSMITKLVMVGGYQVGLPIQRIISSGEREDDMNDGIHGRRLEEARGDLSGTSISLSGNELVLAIGAPLNNAGATTDTGHTRVYFWNSTTNAHVQRGIDLDGQAANEQSGTSVSLSYRGFALAVGSPKPNQNQSGRVRVYTWNGTRYTQEGSDIVEEANNDQFGKSVSLSANTKV
ncbi:hypothetical protein ACHAW5_003482, partial [Stephanodiscus triporus]